MYFAGVIFNFFFNVPLKQEGKKDFCFEKKQHEILINKILKQQEWRKSSNN